MIASQVNKYDSITCFHEGCLKNLDDVIIDKVLETPGQNDEYKPIK